MGGTSVPSVSKKAVWHMGCDPSRHLQESPGPPGPKLQKSLKMVFFGVWRKNVSKNTRKSLKIPIFEPFWVCFRYF